MGKKIFYKQLSEPVEREKFESCLKAQVYAK